MRRRNDVAIGELESAIYPRHSLDLVGILSRVFLSSNVVVGALNERNLRSGVSKSSYTFSSTGWKSSLHGNSFIARWVTLQFSHEILPTSEKFARYTRETFLQWFTFTGCTAKDQLHYHTYIYPFNFPVKESAARVCIPIAKINPLVRNKTRTSLRPRSITLFLIPYWIWDPGSGKNMIGPFLKFTPSNVTQTCVCLAGG